MARTGYYRKSLKSEHWHNIRRDVLERDNNQCQMCGVRRSPFSPLQIHHYHYATLGRERVSDLVALCVPCHKIADKERITHPHKRYKYEKQKGE